LLPQLTPTARGFEVSAWAYRRACLRPEKLSQGSQFPETNRGQRVIVLSEFLSLMFGGLCYLNNTIFRQQQTTSTPTLAGPSALNYRASNWLEPLAPLSPLGAWRPRLSQLDPSPAVRQLPESLSSAFLLRQVQQQLTRFLLLFLLHKTSPWKLHPKHPLLPFAPTLHTAGPSPK
jgi:hypothetical protein